MQYTLRNIPKSVDKALRAKAKADGKSLNEAALEVMKSGLGVSDERGKKRDLSYLGKLTDADAKAIEEAHEFCDRVEIDRRRRA